jgi:hypothetical protein
MSNPHLLSLLFLLLTRFYNLRNTTTYIQPKTFLLRYLFTQLMRHFSISQKTHIFFILLFYLFNKTFRFSFRLIIFSCFRLTSLFSFFYKIIFEFCQVRSKRYFLRTINGNIFSNIMIETQRLFLILENRPKLRLIHIMNLPF